MSTGLEVILMLAPALIAGILITLVHIPLGIEVLRRGIIFLDLAVAQFAALGMIIFYIFFDNYEMAPEFSVAGSLSCGLVLALLCSAGLQAIEKHSGQYQEALIGSAFIFAASLSIVIMAGDPHSSDQMKEIMAGQILWITWTDILLYSPVFIAIAAAMKMLKAKKDQLFYVLFALTIPFSVSLIGVYLVFASLILPALATVSLAHKRTFICYVISVSAFALGLMASYFLDIPSGPAIVMAMFGVSALSFLLIRSKHASL